MDISILKRKNFEAQEFVNSETARKHNIPNLPNAEQLKNGIKLADKIQELRDFFKQPIKQTNAFRCPEVNDLVGGDPKSFHMKFLASDFNVKGMTPVQVVLSIKDSGISVDKCFVERGCVHVQIQSDSSKNRNIFGSAVKVDGEWKVLDEIKKV